MVMDIADGVFDLGETFDMDRRARWLPGDIVIMAADCDENCQQLDFNHELVFGKPIGEFFLHLKN